MCQLLGTGRPHRDQTKLVPVDHWLSGVSGLDGSEGLLMARLGSSATLSAVRGTPLVHGYTAYLLALGFCKRLF
ncbi:hypothetical protein RRG08_019797 [Elysia crispata]|uniref:Uncharacterized protein n=1 Tax=Elysia crispata TaxID=231223 RepID=A0AAE1E5R9_9GAST|nr:hypothetical protein RRG08_019797 [Elysia crispata]